MTRQEDCYCCRPGCPNTAVWEFGAPITANVLAPNHLYQRQIDDCTHSCDDEACKEYLMEPHYEVRRIPEVESGWEAIKARTKMN